jgi:hypothetical protein
MLHLEQSDKKNGACGFADPNAFKRTDYQGFCQ